jgi:hypothetical protein
MQYILHGCDDLDRIQNGLADPSFSGIEVDFHVANGQVCIGHETRGASPDTILTIQDVASAWRDTEKILVADIKDKGSPLLFSVDVGKEILEALHQSIPLQVPMFVVGFSVDWKALVRQTIDMWGERQGAYFVDAGSLVYCQKTFRHLGIRFGLNLGLPVSKIKLATTDLVSSLLEKSDATAIFGNLARTISNVHSEFDRAMWKRAQVKMVWTVTNEAELQAALQLNPDYIIVEA